MWLLLAQTSGRSCGLPSFPTRRSSDLGRTVGHVVETASPDFSITAHGTTYTFTGQIKIAGDDPVDRKSTRLNSSHTVTSYAVVCLKKKSEGWAGRRVGAGRSAGERPRQ